MKLSFKLSDYINVIGYFKKKTLSFFIYNASYKTIQINYIKQKIKQKLKNKIEFF